MTPFQRPRQAFPCAQGSNDGKGIHRSCSITPSNALGRDLLWQNDAGLGYVVERQVARCFAETIRRGTAPEISGRERAKGIPRSACKRRKQGWPTDQRFPIVHVGIHVKFGQYECPAQMSIVSDNRSRVSSTQASSISYSTLTFSVHPSHPSTSSPLPCSSRATSMRNSSPHRDG